MVTQPLTALRRHAPGDILRHRSGILTPPARSLSPGALGTDSPSTLVPSWPLSGNSTPSAPPLASGSATPPAGCCAGGCCVNISSAPTARSALLRSPRSTPVLVVAPKEDTFHVRELPRVVGCATPPAAGVPMMMVARPVPVACTRAAPALARSASASSAPLLRPPLPRPGGLTPRLPGPPPFLGISGYTTQTDG